MEETNKPLDIVSTTQELLSALQSDPIMNEDTQMDVAQSMSVCISEELEKAIKIGLEEFKAKDFYVEIFIRQDPKLPANHAIPKAIVYPHCPTPTHEAAVWRIHRGEPEYLWMVPSVKDGLEMLQNPLAVQDKELFGDLLDFMDGSLRRRAKKLNGEIYV